MATNIRLHGLNLVAGDVATTVDFYRALGVDIPDENVWSTDSGPHHVTADSASDVDLEIDSAALAGAYDEAAARTDPVGSTLIGFGVDTREDVDRIHADLVGRGYTSRQEPEDAFWGSRHAIVEDPDGRPVGIMSPPDAARQAAPPVV